MLREEHNDQFDGIVNFLNRHFYNFVRRTSHIEAKSYDVGMFTLAVWLMQEATDDFLYEKVHTHEMSRRMSAAHAFMRWFANFEYCLPRSREDNYSLDQIMDDFDIRNRNKWFIFECYVTAEREKWRDILKEYRGEAHKERCVAA